MDHSTTEGGVLVWTTVLLRGSVGMDHSTLRGECWYGPQYY